MPFVNHKYVPENEADKKELRALSYLHSQGLDPVSLEVIEKTAATKAAQNISSTGDNEAIFNIYDLTD